VELRARLENAFGAEVSLSATTLESLEALESLLTRWGKAVDLTGFKTRDERDRRYFAEALVALPWLPDAGRALDIGSGGGSPALPLALARRALAWTLVEANERKALFLDEAVRTLALDNARVVRGRYESVSVEPPVDVVTLRGVAVTEGMLEKIRAELGPGGRLLWFSSEARLREAERRFVLETEGGVWAKCDGPTRLVPEGGFLLVVTASTDP
jgi:16S rRNA (guanine527-N7)-methyltransferase